MLVIEEYITRVSFRNKYVDNKMKDNISYISLHFKTI